MSKAMDHSPDAAAFSAFRQCGPVRHGLPGLAYTSEAFHALENQSLFRNSWVFVGFAHKIADPGDVRPIPVGGQPVLLVRNAEGTVRAFHNVCRHRCLKLVDEPAHVGKLIQCPYHAWAYGLDGTLKASPFFGGRRSSETEGFDRHEHGLVPIRCAVWYDWIFLNLSGEAPDFIDFARPLLERLSDLDLRRLQPLAELDFGDVKANWKLLIENFIEPYHVQFVHRRTTDQPLRNHYTIVDSPCLGSAVDVDAERPAGGKRGHALAVSSRYLTLFPNFVIGFYQPDQIGVHLNCPTGPSTTRQRRLIYSISDHDIGDPEAMALRDLWYQVHKEDHAMCERLQQGRLSEVAANGGLLSPHWEDSVRRFQELVLDAVT